MDIFEKLRESGEKLGLSGTELARFVQEERDREERLEKEKSEREERFQAREVQKLEIEREIELQRSRREVSMSPVTHESGGAKVKLPKLPSFNERHDNIEAYISRFERFAESAGWDNQHYATNLSALLTGKALEVYSRMSVADCNNYEVLKQNLLKRFNMTEEGFRSKFRGTKMEQGETPTQFIVRLENYLDNWVGQANAEISFKGLKDLVLKEQFMTSANKNLQLFLKERKFGSVKEMADAADLYVEAHENQKFGHTNVMQTKVCFICQGNHFKRDCPKMKPQHAAAMTQRGWNQHQPRRYAPRYPENRRSNGYDNKRNTLSACCVAEKGMVKLECGHKLPVMSVACKQRQDLNMPVYSGMVGEKKVSVLRDTGCSTIVVKRALVSEANMTGEEKTCVLVDGTVRRFPTAIISIDTPFYTGKVTAMCMEAPVYDLIVGNIEGLHSLETVTDKNAETTNQIGAVKTRAQAKAEKVVKPMKVPPTIDIGPTDLRKSQREDESLASTWSMERSGEIKTSGKANTYRYFTKEGMLYRKFESPKHHSGQAIRQLVVPTKYRKDIMKMAHESLLGGHLGTQKTADKIMTQFHWPGILSDVKRFCMSCDTCQRTIAKGKVKRVPLENVPIIETPFQKVAIDLVGPIAPASERGHRYILTLVDYATRYPEAIPLKNVEAETVAEALMEMFTRVGVPREILSDRGTQFMSGLMSEVSRLLSVKQLFTTPYHAQANGLVEKMNGTLKTIIRKLCVGRPKDWDKYLCAALFAYREAPQASTGFSPFELLYGRTVRGPMMILKELMTKDLPETDIKSVYQYIMDLKDRLQETMEIANEELRKAQRRYKINFDRRAKTRTLKPGDKALILLPTNNNKLLMQWKGPFEVTDKINEVDYKLNINGKEKIYHANMIKQYLERNNGVHLDREENDVGEEVDIAEAQNLQAGALSHIGAAIIEEESDDGPNNKSQEQISELKRQTEELELPILEQKENASDVNIGELATDEKQILTKLLDEYPDVLTDVPGKTKLAEHHIKLTTDEPIRSRPYHTPHAVKEEINTEVESMLKMGVIEPSDSPYCSPIVIVRKPDGTNRFCVDYRKINQVTVFDAEPMPNPEDIFSKLTGCRYFSRIDLSKGYWQIPVAEESKMYTSFATSTGLWQFRRMPFGLSTAPGVFSRMMRKLLKDMTGADNFMDDILLFTVSFDQHMVVLRELLERLRKSHLTARPSKCMIAFKELDFVGHKVSDGEIKPNMEKVKAIEDATPPKTKKQVRSFLGMVGYYRKFIPNFAQLAVPLTDLTKKGKLNNVEWRSPQERSFKSLKAGLTKEPVLKMADLSKPFILRTDASKEGLGAVLLQEFDNEKWPVAYASRKLLPREQNYAVVEKECLGVVWGIQKFSTFLYGNPFTLQTDHMPLVYLNKAKESNSRIMRWALILQPYRFTVEAIKGSDNVGADYLSRI